MRPFLPLLILLLPVFLFSQKENSTQLIFLKDGSVLKGTLQENSSDETVKVTLTDGSEINFSKNLLLHARDASGEQVIFNDGRRVIESGRYSTIAMHSLAGRRSSESNDEMRWGLGAHFTTGYQFSPALAVGGGIGLDAHQYNFAPVFAEVSGFLVRKEFRRSQANRQKSNSNVRSGGELKKLNRNFPFCYSLQIGYNVPLNELFSSGNLENTGGGALIYPSVGLLFPSRFGNTFRFDFGYKFQHFTKSYTPVWWNNYRTRDAVTLKSFALRAGWIF